MSGNTCDTYGPDNPAVTFEKDHGQDLVLHASSCWVQVENIAVYISRGNEGVNVELLPVGCEAFHEGLATAYASFKDAAEEIEEHECDN